MFTIEVDGLPPSLNDYYSGVHWSKRKRMADEWHENFLIALKLIKCPRKLSTPIEVTCIQQCKGRVRDADNAVLGAKFFQDSLKMFGYIEDDGPEYISQVVLMTEKGGRDKTIIKF